MKDSVDHVIQNAAPMPAIRLGDRTDRAKLARAGLLLVVFMRMIAALWLIEGALQWSDLLSGPTADDFLILSAQRIAAIFFFCVLDFVAAVGLWLATPWGGVVWLVTVGVQILCLLVLPGFWSHGAMLAGSDAVLVCAYFGLAWYAARFGGERSEYS